MPSAAAKYHAVHPGRAALARVLGCRAFELSSEVRGSFADATRRQVEEIGAAPRASSANDSSHRALGETVDLSVLKSGAVFIDQITTVRAGLETCRRRGFALDDEEYTEGICADGVGFLRLLAARDRISEALGGSPETATTL